MSENKKEYDYEGYAKSLEKVLDGVTKDYWTSYVDINRHQVAVGRTYLWVSAALIGVYTAGFEYFKTEIISNSMLAALGILTLILAFLAFGICLYAIPARKGYKTIPIKGWGEFSHEAYRLLNDKSEALYPTFLGDLISKIDTAFAFNFRTNQKRALLLRITSWLLIASFCTAVSAALGASFQKYQPTETTEVLEMAEENESNSNQPSGSETQSGPAVPVPPPTADIGGTVYTHSEDPPANRQTFTEGVAKK
jgi:hypothetical protein